ncbi:MAG: hypothetical protein Q9159_001849 [Coniocarpon cinnabarinum]
MKGLAGPAVATLLSASGVVAFPSLNLGNTRHTQHLVNVGKRQILGGPQGAGALPLLPPPFDAEAQYVSNQGEHAFVAPGSGDARGECPGLNALANHNYLPHNGVATIQQFIDATYNGVGMERDLGGFLAVYGAIIDGDGTSWSIEGVPHTGIAGSHHNYESDSSPFKPDLNQYGSNERFVMSQFKTLYDMQPDPTTANYNLEVFRDFRNTRFRQSVSDNPYFFYGPFDGLQVSQAAYTFIYRFMSNKSAENPEGVLNQEVLKSWHSVQGEGDDMMHVPGHERIPDNWYKRNAADTYSIPYFEADILYFAAKYPEILTVGCNAGKGNTYGTIDPDVLTAGAATLQSLTSNPFCFGVNFLEAAGPSLLGLSDSQTSSLNSALQLAASAGSCAPNPITDTSLTQLQNCPGFSLYGGPEGPIAPGAVQDGPLS